MGWFVKDGVDDLAVSPLMGLYKTQIRQLAVYLGVPESIRKQTPSPDMIKGITDEIAMGILYDTVDRILDCIDRGLDDQKIVSMGISREEIDLVRDINRLSEWKRANYHEEPPVRGTVDGGQKLTEAGGLTATD